MGILNSRKNKEVPLCASTFNSRNVHLTYTGKKRRFSNSFYSEKLLLEPNDRSASTISTEQREHLGLVRILLCLYVCLSFSVLSYFS